MTDAVKFDCSGCGADLVFEPGTSSLTCPYCGQENTIQRSAEVVEELDFEEFLRKASALQQTQEVLTVKCPSCSAETTLPPNVTSDTCPFCGTGLVASAGHSTKLLKPKGVLPFTLTQQEGRQKVTAWINSRWFAPNRLKAEAEKDKLLKGMYLPYWTYDCGTTSNYSGERGQHYTVSETVTVNGRQETRQVQKTRWYSAAGTVHVDFDDVLVLGSHSLPKKYAGALEPWDLDQLVPYQEEYLAGFRTESYQVTLEQGFVEAKSIMAPQIEGECRRDIGGDEQRVHSVNTSYTDITFKHILLPVWIGAYRYGGKVYQFQVNARTGEVQGTRPYSWIKITLFVLMILIVIIVILSIAK